MIGRRLLSSFERLFERGAVTQPFRATVGGLLVGLLAAWIPAIAGNGYEPLNVILDERLAMGAVLALIAVKIVAPPSRRAFREASSRRFSSSAGAWGCRGLML